MQAVIIEDLVKQYPNVIALNHLSLKISANQIFGFVGPDGAGKTSLFQILCGILRVTSGKVTALGVDLSRQPEKLKQDLGYMSQKFALYADLTVRENLDFFAEIFGSAKEGIEERKLRLLEFAGLLSFQDRLAGNLSGGMKQKLALCCTLIHTPRLLILDEPTTGVDPVSRQEFWEMLLPLPSQGTTVIVSTAYMDEAARCDTVAMLDQGEILKIGTPKELREILQGRVFEAKSNQLKELKQLLKGYDWYEEVQVFGDRLHIRVRPSMVGEVGRNALSKLLNEGGLNVVLNQVEPSLEDVFVSLTGQKIGDETGADSRSN